MKWQWNKAQEKEDDKETNNFSLINNSLNKDKIWLLTNSSRLESG